MKQYTKTAAKVTGLVVAGILALFLVIGGIGALVPGGGDAPTKPEKKESEPYDPSHPEDTTEPDPLKGTKENPAKDDVKVGPLKDMGYEMYEQTLTITNHSSKTSDYMIDVAYKDASGQRVASDTAAEANVKPGETVTTTILPVEKPAETVVTDVERTESY